MTNGLEKFVVNTGKGLAAGAMTFIDPMGAFIAGVDYAGAGIGPADKVRGNDTLYNSLYKAIYSNDMDEKHELSTGYLPRLIGTFGGAAATYGLGALLWTAVNPWAAVVVPIATGLYSLARGAYRYAKDFVDGEEIDGKREKGSFLDGAKFGWHELTSFLASDFQPYEGTLTGRGYDNSHIRGSSATWAAKGARRNFASMAGTFVGGLGGVIADVATLMTVSYTHLRAHET